MYRRIRVFEILKRERNNSSDEPNRILPSYIISVTKKNPHYRFTAKAYAGQRLTFAAKKGEGKGREGKGREGKGRRKRRI